MSITPIQWTDLSINPIRARNIETGAVGHYCEKPSPGCTNCYASRWNTRVRPSGKHLIGTGLAFDVRNRSRVEIFLDEAKLNEVIRRRKPSKFFWCDMTDMFGEWVSDEMIDRCFATMAITPQHTHQVLTKRADRMRRYMEARALSAAHWHGWPPEWTSLDLAKQPGPGRTFPLPNVWLGVSVENQKYADERIPLLLQTPAAVRFISAEPLLGPVNLHQFICKHADPERIGHGFGPWCDNRGDLHWVIVGGESGPGARPFDLAWARFLVQQCKEAGVACFVKQLGADPFEAYSNGERLADVDLANRKGGDIAEWPEELRVRQFPEVRA